MPSPPRPLIVAEAANPEWVSVPLVGWSLARALQQRTGGHIVTQIRNRDAILRAGLTEGTDFTVIDSEALARPMWKLASVLRMGSGKGWTTATAISSLVYPYFERLVWTTFRDRLKAGEFDLVHRITPLSPTANSSLAPRCDRIGVPFVLGPLNGGVPWPAAFDAERRREKEWLSYVRGAYRALPGRGAMLRRSAAILAGSRHTESEIPALHRERVVYMPENGIDTSRFDRMARPAGQAPLRACFLGRLVPYKGPDMALCAAAPLLADGRLRLDVVGDGPMGDALRRQAHDAGLAEAVTFHGAVPHQRVQDILADCDVLLFPSIREFGGGVVLEAMAVGVVPLVVDYAGPGELVDGSTGFKVALGERNEIVARLRTALEALCADPGQLPVLAAAGRDRVRDLFTWEAKAAQVCEVYDWVTGRRPDKPVFPFPG